MRKLMTIRDDTGRHLPLERIDPDIVLVTDYLAGELSAVSARALEERLVEDEPFFDKVWPLLRAWNLPRGAPGQEFRTTVAAARETPARPPRQRAWTPFRTVAAAAAVVVVATGLVVALRARSRQAIRIASVEMPPPPTAADISRDSLLRSLTNDSAIARLPGPSVIATGLGETRVVVLADSTTVTLAPLSWVAYADSAAAIGGEAQLVVKGSGKRTVLTVVTAAGEASLAAGRYAIRSVAKQAVLVRVIKGLVTLRAKRGRPHPPHRITDGQQATIG
jgi:ferric-dicitrate binding protein FerR (iron transport regulator)